MVRSDTQEDVSAVHPVEGVPVDQEGETAEYEWLQPSSEEVQQAVAEVGAQGRFDEVLPQVRDEVGGDGVHAHDDEGEGQLVVAAFVDAPGEGREEVKADASAEERPCRGPDAFDDGIDAEEMKQHSSGYQSGACGEHPAKGDLRRGGDEPLPGDEAEEHGSQGGNEAEGEIASTVEEERGGSRKEIEEPEVEGPSEVRVLVPVRGESLEKMRMPLRRHADLGVVEAGGRKRVESPCEPIEEEDGTERGPLPARF